MTTSKSGGRAHILAIGLAAALTAMYGVVPARPEIFGVAPRPYWMILENGIGGAILIAIVLFIGWSTRKSASTRLPVSIHPVIAASVFFGGCYWFSEYNWVTSREGFEGTVAALFRIFWFVIIINVRHGTVSLPVRSLYLLATVILMFFDQSRTYFLIALLILAADLGWSAIVAAIVMALMVAAIRSDENYGFYHSAMFAIGGEGYLGSQGVFQVLSIGAGGIDFITPAVQAIFSPVTALITQLGKRFDLPIELLDSTTYLGYYIQATTGETYPPMGGFFIISEFIRAGWIGILCMTAYMTTVYVLTKRMFDTADFPIGSFIAILAIKNSPATYWSLTISVFFVAYVFRRLSVLAGGLGVHPQGTNLQLPTRR